MKYSKFQLYTVEFAIVSDSFISIRRSEILSIIIIIINVMCVEQLMCDNDYPVFTLNTTAFS